MIRKYFPLLLIFLGVLILFGSLLKLYFSQDDFYHLWASQTDGSLGSFFNFFAFRSKAEGALYFYRPIFREVLFNLYQNTFGLTPLPFRLTQFVIHVVNTVLVFWFVGKVSKNKLIGLVASGLFSLSAANVGVLSYLAGGIQASGMTLFMLSSLIFFDKYLDKRMEIFRVLAFVFFLLALASHELAVSIPFLAIGLIFLKKRLGKKLFTQSFFLLWPYFAVLIVFLILDIRVIGLPASEKQYSLNLAPSRMANSYVWYFIWAIGIPEMLLDFVGPGLTLNPSLMKYWGDYFKVIFPAFLIIILFFIYTAKRLLIDKLFWFFLLWFVVGIAPIVILPLHRSYYYLVPVLPAIGGIVGLCFWYIFRESKIVSYLFLGSLLLLSFTSVKLADKTYWAISRARVAEKLIKDIKSKYPSLPKGASVYYENDPSYPYISGDWGGTSKQVSVILSGSDALQLVYNDPTLKVYYEDISPQPLDATFDIKAEIPH